MPAPKNSQDDKPDLTPPDLDQPDRVGSAGPKPPVDEPALPDDGNPTPADAQTSAVAEPTRDDGGVGGDPASQNTLLDAGRDENAATQDPLAAVTAERDEYLDRWQRSRADYDNLNKRRLKEVGQARDRGAAAVVDRLLEVLDNFGFAMQAANASDDAQLSKGVQLVHGQLIEALRQSGLEEVPGAGSPFDPAHHEAVISESDGSEREQPEVSEVLRTGYRFKSQLLRPASVKVVE